MSKINGKIYKIFCKDKNIGACYIGSTVDLNRRIREHRNITINPSRPEYNYPIYETIRTTGGWDNWSYDILAHAKVDNYEQLRNLERQYIKNTEYTLNQCIPNRTRKEHYQDQRKDILEYKKRYHQQNRVKILKKRRERYYANLEKNRLNGNLYYQKNKHLISQKRKLPRYWITGVQTSMSSNLFKHLKTKKHKTYMELFTKKLNDHLESKFPRLSHTD